MALWGFRGARPVRCWCSLRTCRRCLPSSRVRGDACFEACKRSLGGMDPWEAEDPWDVEEAPKPGVTQERFKSLNEEVEKKKTSKRWSVCED